jgi:hypothetical protein
MIAFINLWCFDNICEIKMTAVPVGISDYFRGYNLSGLFSLEVRDNEIR